MDHSDSPCRPEILLPLPLAAVDPFNAVTVNSNGVNFPVESSVTQIQAGHVVRTARGGSSFQTLQALHVCLIKALIAKLLFDRFYCINSWLRIVND